MEAGLCEEKQDAQCQALAAAFHPQALGSLGAEEREVGFGHEISPRSDGGAFSQAEFHDFGEEQIVYRAFLRLRLGAFEERGRRLGDCPRVGKRDVWCRRHPRMEFCVRFVR
ncbi:hypothetical protein GCM10010207_55800 [Streptomyces atratus]|nr:hypothetical protein GCM10010207_55800 [Streptomyces atratus]